MIFKMKVTQDMRQRLAFAENISLDLSEAPEVKELQASAAEAHLHIDALHAVIKTGDLKTAELLINDWEVSQCPF